jgi:hypothetical protein
MRAAKQTPEQRCADTVAAREFYQMQKFVAACRRQWPDAVIVLRPNDDASQVTDAPTNLKLAPERQDDDSRL